MPGIIQDIKKHKIPLYTHAKPIKRKL